MFKEADQQPDDIAVGARRRLTWEGQLSNRFLRTRQSGWGSSARLNMSAKRELHALPNVC